MTAKNGFTEYESETVIGEVEKRKRVLFCSVTSGPHCIYWREKTMEAINTVSEE